MERITTIVANRVPNELAKLDEVDKLLEVIVGGRVFEKLSRQPNRLHIYQGSGGFSIWERRL